MLVARAPMRVSLAGGGTDLEAYYTRYGGLVISTTINKYFYTLITPEQGTALQIISADYRTLFRHSPYKDLYWDGDLALPKAVLHHFAVQDGLNLFLASEIPPGTGLGSSSAAAVALIKALSTLLEQPMSRQQVAELAAYVEITKMGMPIGKQDQYAAAYGGMNKMTFSTHGVLIEPLQIALETRQLLERRLMLFFTGTSRTSTSILKHQRKFTEEQEPSVLRALHTIKQIALKIQTCLERGNLDTFAALLDEAWQEKRRLVAGLSNTFIDDCYERARACGAMGGKITGAGGGGFLLLYCPEHAQENVTLTLEELGVKRMDFGFSEEGAKVMLNVTNADPHWISACGERQHTALYAR